MKARESTLVNLEIILFAVEEGVLNEEWPGPLYRFTNCCTKFCPCDSKQPEPRQSKALVGLPLLVHLMRFELDLSSHHITH